MQKKNTGLNLTTHAYKPCDKDCKKINTCAEQRSEQKRLSEGRFDLTKTGVPSRLANRFVQLSKPRQEIVEKLTGLVKGICKKSKTKHPGAGVVAEGWNI